MDLIDTFCSLDETSMQSKWDIPKRLENPISSIGTKPSIAGWQERLRILIQSIEAWESQSSARQKKKMLIRAKCIPWWGKARTRRDFK